MATRRSGLSEPGDPVLSGGAAIYYNGHLCCPNAVTETDAQGDFPIDSLFANQEVEV